MRLESSCDTFEFCRIYCRQMPSRFKIVDVFLQIIILCDHHHFRVAVNGTHQLDYKHRVSDLKQITELEVLGDVQLLSMSSSEAISNQ